MLVHSTENAHPTILALLETWGLEPGAVDLEVDAADEMYQFSRQLRHGSRELALVDYFRAGWTAFETLRRVIDGVFPPERRKSLKILDFASGYGRMTRFFVQRYGASGITVGEIDPKAVAFQRQRFGVRGVVSARDPEQLDLEGPFDCIFVASLFSHLPRATFESWLTRLYGLLAPGGLLVFSVHDAAVMLPGRTLPEDGFYFESMSESELLDLEDYGSTWVSEAWVADAMERVSGSRRYRRIPRGLWHLQDLYLLPRGDLPALEALTLTRGLEGYVDACELRTDGRLRLGGWAVDHGAGSATDPVDVQVEIHVNGERLRSLRPHDERPDVARLLGEAFRRSAWEVVLEPPGEFWSSGDLLLVKVRGAEVEYVIFACTLETALLHTALADERLRLGELRSALGHTQQALVAEQGTSQGLREEIALRGELIEGLGWEKHLLEERIAGMEASRFWRLRNRWFRLKGALGLAGE